MSSIKLILDLLGARAGTPERLELEREAYELLKTQLLAPHGGVPDPTYEESLIARAKAALQTEETARSATELRLAAADQLIVRDDLPKPEVVSSALTQVDTLIVEQGTIIFWREGSRIYVSFDDPVKPRHLEFAGYEPLPYLLTPSDVDSNLFEINALTPDTIFHFLELHVNDPERFTVRWS